MSHSPEIPKGNQSPYPLQKPEAADRNGARHDLAEKIVAKAADASPADTARWPRYAAGAAIGSAAIVAGLLYYNRSKPD